MAKKTRKPPELNPYVFTVLLAAFGLWCFYDGFFNPKMVEHAMINRVIGCVLIPWAIWDFFKVKKALARRKANAGQAAPAETSSLETPPDTPPKAE